MYKFGILSLLLWKTFLISEQIVSVYTCSHIICSLMKMTACQADFVIHPYIVKSLLYFTCIQSIHSSTYARATEWYVGSLTVFVLLYLVYCISCIQHVRTVCWWSRCLPCSLQGETRQPPLLFFDYFPSLSFSTSPCWAQIVEEKLFSCRM